MGSLFSKVFSKEGLDIAMDVMTILGVLFAIYEYLRWKKNYKLQKAHTYAIDMLQKLYYLQCLIEELRSPKLIPPGITNEDFEESSKSMISEIISEARSLRSNFMPAKYILLKNKNIMDQYVDLIIKEILNPIREAFRTFRYECQAFERENTRLGKLIFTIFIDEKTNLVLESKRSDLGTQQEVVKDEFNKIIENNFKTLNKLLNEEISAV